MWARDHNMEETDSPCKRGDAVTGMDRLFLTFDTNFPPNHAKGNLERDQALLSKRLSKRLFMPTPDHGKTVGWSIGTIRWMRWWWHSRLSCCWSFWLLWQWHDRDNSCLIAKQRFKMSGRCDSFGESVRWKVRLASFELWLTFRNATCLLPASSSSFRQQAIDNNRQHSGITISAQLPAISFFDFRSPPRQRLFCEQVFPSSTTLIIWPTIIIDTPSTRHKRGTTRLFIRSSPFIRTIRGFGAVWGRNHECHYRRLRDTRLVRLSRRKPASYSDRGSANRWLIGLSLP